MIPIAKLLFLVLALGARPLPSAIGQEPDAPRRPKNLVLMIADGFGPASRTMARVCAGRPLVLDGLLVGSASTHATNSLVTDSAAAATALACGVKTSNGAIALDPQGKPLATLLEAAEERGMWTGLVTTTQLSHATPAAFAAHVRSRVEQSAIALQQLERDIEVLMGGGREFLLPQAQGGERRDDRNLFALAEERGYTIVESATALAGVTVPPLLAIFGAGQMHYEIDREPLGGDQPSLEAMTRKALELLAASEEGFFLLVEGGRIDHAGHANDSAAHLHDVLAYDRAVAAALEFARADGATLLVSTADHETGGLTLSRDVDGRPGYTWKPEVLNGVRSSVDGLVFRLRSAEDWRPVLAEWTGIGDWSPAEVGEVEAALAEPAGSAALPAALREAIDRRAFIGWTTGGHTGIDVEVFAFGPQSERLRGHRDNAELGGLLAELLGFHLADLTEALRR